MKKIIVDTKIVIFWCLVIKLEQKGYQNDNKKGRILTAYIQ